MTNDGSCAPRRQRASGNLLSLFLTCSVPLYAALLALSFRGVAPFAKPEEAAQGILNHEYDYRLLWMYVSLTVGLFLVYFWSLWMFHRHPLRLRTVMGVGLLVAVLSFLAYPGVLSNDVMAYVGYGRLMSVHHLNPWSHGYADVDDFYSYYAWYPHAMPYGPVVAPFLAVAGWLSEKSVPLSFYFVKLCWLAVHMVNGWFVFRVALALRRVGQAAGVDPRMAAWTYLCNPLLGVELVNNGHCDGLLVLFGLLSLDALLRGRDHTALFFGLLGLLVKPTAVLLVAVEAVWLLRQRRLLPVLWFVLEALTVFLVLSRTLFSTDLSREALTNPHYLTNAYSIHSVFIHYVDPDYLNAYETDAYDQVRANLAAAFALFCVWRLYCVRTFQDVIREYLLTSIALVLFYSARVWPWYLSWLVPFAVLGRDGPLRRCVLLLSMTVLVDYAVPFRLLKGSFPWHLARVAISLGLPLTVWAVDALYSRHRVGI